MSETIEHVDWQALRASAAARHSVSPEVHQDDFLWHFIAAHPAFPEPENVADYYFSDGAESATKLARLIADNLPRAVGDRYSLLEFASGYGMVTRHLRNALPEADVLACDIHQEAVDFVNKSLGEEAILSRHLPEELEFERQFDVVFALSFFSHMPSATFGRWLAALYRAVGPGGILAFTTHGLASMPALGNPTLSDDGFWFRADSEQHDLQGAEYGSTLSAPDYVIRELFRHTHAPLADFKHGYWWGHQDLYVAVKPPG